MIMCGADGIGVCTETMFSGFAFLGKWIKSLKDYMKKMGFETTRFPRPLDRESSQPLNSRSGPGMRRSILKNALRAVSVLKSGTVMP